MGGWLRGVGVLAVAGAGVLLALVHAGRLLDTMPFTAEPLGSIAAATMLVLATALLPTALRLQRRRPTAREVARVWSWILIATAAVTVTVTLVTAAAPTNTPGAGRFVLGGSVGVPDPVALFTFGVAFGVVVGSYDLSIRRRAAAYHEAREMTEREHERLSALFEGAPNSTIFFEYVDGDPIVLDVNTAFEETFGYPEAEIRGRSIDEYVVPPDRREEAARINERLSDKDLQLRVTRRTADGDRDFILYTIPLPDRPERGFATYVDITAEKRSEQRLQVLNRVLRHDLRNSMNVVIGHADNLASPDADVEPAVAARAIRARAETLLSRGRKARGIERLLEAGTGTRTVDVADLVGRRVRRARADGDLTVDLDVPDAPAWATVSDRFDVAVDNLLENVADHGGGTAAVTVTAGDPATGRAAIVTVRDRGPGIPSGEIDALNREIETPLEHASGLGLWLVTWTVRDAGGTIRFDNHADGAEVRLELPAAESP